MIIRNFLGNKSLRKLCSGKVRMLGMLLAFAVLLGVSSAVAQTITATVRGTVLDPAGAVVPGASITARNVDTGVKTGTVTDQNGGYSIRFLPIGTYTVTAAVSGFETSSVGPFVLQIDQIAKIDIQLKVGSVSTTVSVNTETSPELQTESATLGTSISSASLEGLPLSGLNFQSAGMFVPGAVNPSYSAMGGSSGTERDTSSATQPSFNGNRQQGNNYILDGVEINETMDNLAGYNPAPDALQEMRVITVNADAEYGDVNGGEMVMVTKGGTNKFHGSLYELYEDQQLTANLWSNNYSGIAKGKFAQSQFGATIGGPIKKNKLFFFGDYEGFRNHAAGTGSASVATPLMRTGDFSEVFADKGYTLYNTGITATNPTGGTQYATPYMSGAAGSGTCPNSVETGANAGINCIPVVNPVAKYLFAHPEVYPLPNYTPSTLPDSGNYHGASQSAITNNQGDVRIDYTLDSKDTLMSRYSMGDAYDATPKAVLPATFPSGNDYPVQSVVVNWVHVFTPALVNEFRGGFTRVHWIQGAPTDPSGEFGVTGDKTMGIPLPNQPYAGFSEMNIATAESNIGTAAVATTFVENNFDYGDDFTWQHGKHLTKFGVQVVRYQQNFFYPGNYGAMGEFAYDNEFTANPTPPKGVSAPGYGFAEVVLDQATWSAIGGVSGPVGQRQYRDAAYVQDDWKARRNLTVNLGLRYGFDQPIYEVNNKELNVDISNPSACTGTPDPCLEYAGQGANSRALYNPYRLEYMPRLGFSWEAKPKIVVRGGYGITDYFEGTGDAMRPTQNPPFLHQFKYNTSTPTATSGGAPIPVENGFNTSAGALTTASTTYEVWAKNLRPTFVQQFNLTAQYLLSTHTTAQVGYVGEIGQHLIVPVQANEYTAVGGGSAASEPFYGLVGHGGTVYVTESEGVENYNALQAVLKRQQSNGLQYTVNYTWSKAMSNNPGFFGVSGVSGASVYWQDQRNPRADYAPSAYDTRQAVNGTVVYQLPIGRGARFVSHSNRVIDGAIGGWRVSGDMILYSGFPENVTSPNNAALNAPTSRANRYGKMKIVGRNIHNWWGTDPTAAPCQGSPTATGANPVCAYGYEVAAAAGTPAPAGLGTSAPNTERAPGYRIIDMSLFKAFPSVKGEKLEFRVDAFNALNMASYAAPSLSTSAYSGTIGVSPAPSIITYKSGNSWGKITGTSSPARQFQLALHYRF
jgi:hypothetical protein